MNEIIREVGKDIYINKQHYDNPFAQKDSCFYVRLVAIKDDWIAYISNTNNIRYMRFNEFFNVFQRPKNLYIGICCQFSNLTIKQKWGIEEDIKEGASVENPYSFDRRNENYVSEKYLDKLIIKQLKIA